MRLQRAQKKFIKHLCSTWNGKNFVRESELRTKWRKCPEHDVIINFGKDEFFYIDYNLQDMGFMPTEKALAFVREVKRDRMTVATLVVALATMLLTVCQLLFK